MQAGLRYKLSFSYIKDIKKNIVVVNMTLENDAENNSTVPGVIHRIQSAEVLDVWQEEVGGGETLGISGCLVQLVRNKTGAN